LHGIKGKAKMNSLPDFDAVTLLDSPDLKCPPRGLIANLT
jgi:hypothetical protein